MLLLSCKTNTNPCPLLDQVWIESATVFPLSDTGITTPEILYVITWGFGVVLLGWLLGYVLGLALGLIKKA